MIDLALLPAFPRERVALPPPQRGKAWIYALLDGQSLIYIGCTTNLKTRLSGHSKKPFTHLKLHEAPNQIVARKIERSLISQWKPPLNKSLVGFVEEKEGPVELPAGVEDTSLAGMLAKLPKKGSKVNLNFRITKAELRTLEGWAIENKCPVSWVIRCFIAHGVEMDRTGQKLHLLGVPPK